MTASHPLMQDTARRAALRRWDRLGIAVRCAYRPDMAQIVRHYMAAGRQVVAVGALSELSVQQRVLAVLLRTARDDALPWFWRSVCLEHATFPLARLRSLLQLHDPIAVHAMECTVQAARDGLPAPSARTS